MSTGRGSKPWTIVAWAGAIVAVLAAWPGVALGQAVGQAVGQPVGQAVDAAERLRALRGEALPWVLAGLSVASLLILWLAGAIRPGSLANRRDVGEHPWWVWFAGAAMAYVMGPFVAGFAGAMGLLGPASGSLFQPMTALLTGLAGCLAGLVLIRLLDQSGRAGLGVRGGSLVVGLGAFVLAYPLIIGVGVLAVRAHLAFGGTIESALAHDTLRRIVEERGTMPAWILIIVAGLVAPAFEEILYRGLVQSAVLRATGHAWGAVLLTSAGFAAVHTVGTGMPWYAVAQVFVLSVAMGVALERTRSLGAPIAMHVAFNCLNIAQAHWVG